MGNNCGKQTQDDKYQSRGKSYRKQDGSTRFQKEGFSEIQHVILPKHRQLSDLCTAIAEKDQVIARYAFSCSRLKQKLSEAEKTNSKQQQEISQQLGDIRRLEKEKFRVQKKNEDVQTRKLAEIEEIDKRLQREKDKNARQEQEIKDLREKNSEILTRLSAMAGAKLTDGNANIADLSDKNRPTKLAEQFSELYDNEWTDAFGNLTHSGKHSEEESCKVLVSILCKTYSECKDLSVKEMDTLLSAFKAFNAGQEPPSEVLKMFKDIRKKTPKDAMTIFKETKLNVYIHELMPQEQDRRDVKAFFDKCLQLCWLMVVQDPSVHIDTENAVVNERFDSNTHKPYTKSGSLVDFLVWPTLYLCKGGGILAKGVVQCKSIKTPVSPKTKSWSYSRRDIKSESYDVKEKENVGISKEINHKDSHAYFNPATSHTLGNKNQNKSGQEGSFRTTIDTRSFRGSSGHPS